jgi:uncharacterized protein YndB with AHSA1/START domain
VHHAISRSPRSRAPARRDSRVDSSRDDAPFAQWARGVEIDIRPLHEITDSREVSMLKIFVIVVVVLVGAVLAYAATRPDAFRVQRTLSIKAPPEKIFALINDLRGWGAWSPYEKKDPAMKRMLSGAASGKGAVYEWEGNGDVGKGRMEIAETSPPTKVVIKLDFVKPFEAHNTVEFSLEPRGDATKVSWAIFGPSPYLSKLMGIFLDMDKMIGKDFEDGLASLKAVAER